MHAQRVKKGEIIQAPAPSRGGHHDGWMTCKAEHAGLFVKGEPGDGGGIIFHDETLAALGYYYLTASQKKLLGISSSKKVPKK